MKKIFRILSLVLTLILVINPCQIYASSDSIGLESTRANVCVYFRDENGIIVEIPANLVNYPITLRDSVIMFEILAELPSSTISAFNTNYDNLSSNDARLYTATAYFNCHSYAWYSQNTSANHYWMNDPKQYYESGLYYEVSTPAVGDIICYFDNLGTLANTADDENLHSAIVVEIHSSNLTNGLAGNYTVESKWDSKGLYRHNGYECPYTAYVGASADYVKFYRKSGHTHSFNTYNDTGDAYYHECICSCGMIIHDEHNWALHYGTTLATRAVEYVPEYYCSDCGAFTLHPT